MIDSAALLPSVFLELWSVADMDLERAAGVGAAFDEDPELRPLRVGGDPARIRVEGSLARLIRDAGLPIEWLTVRTNSRREGFEGGEFTLLPGRGGWIGSQDAAGEWQYKLTGHRVTADYLRSWTDAEDGRLDRVERLFGRLGEAMDACYGIATVVPRRAAIPPPDRGLGDVGWLNLFGPAFLERFAALGSGTLPARRLANGGVLLRVGDAPWALDETAKQAVRDAVGPEAFVRIPYPHPPGVLVPSYQEHMRHSPGTDEMPWVARQRRKDADKVARSRERRYATARRRRLKAQDGRARHPGLVSERAEWSTSMDAADWSSFARILFRRLGGDLGGPLGRAAADEILTAPVGLEESMVAVTSIGAIEVRWFIDDVDTVDIFQFGPDVLPRFVDEIHDEWAQG